MKKQITITENPNYAGPDRFQILLNGDKYLLSIGEAKVCWVPNFAAAQKLLEDTNGWVYRNYIA